MGTRKISCADIRACPFCGNQALHLLRTNTAFGNTLPNGMFHVACEECASFGPSKETEDEAVNVWNDVSRVLWG